MIEAALALCLLVAVGALVWRAIEDRKERTHLLHLLVAKNPAEAVMLDRSVNIAGKATQARREDFTHASVHPEYEDVGLRPIGL